MWWLTKAKTELKREHWTKRWNWSGRRKLVLRASCTHGRIAQSVRALVVLKSPSVVNSIYIYIYINIYIYIYIYITILKRNDGQSKCVMTLKKESKKQCKKEKYVKNWTSSITYKKANVSFSVSVCQVYLCETCHQHLYKKENPCQAVSNKITLHYTPVELKD